MDNTLTHPHAAAVAPVVRVFCVCCITTTTPTTIHTTTTPTTSDPPAHTIRYLGEEAFGGLQDVLDDADTRPTIPQRVFNWWYPATAATGGGGK